jgi:hexosaminidase
MERTPAVGVHRIWGNSEGIYEQRRPARDQSIPLPPAPAADLSYHSDWAQSNARRLQLIEDSLPENEELIGLLHQNINLEMLRSIAGMDELLKAAAEQAQKNQARPAVQSVDRAINIARSIQFARNRALRDATQTWYKTWYPRVSEANGRKFLHELDDVKDHLPDRTTDMSYLVYRELLLPFGEWVEQIQAARNQYAQSHQIPAVNYRFDWKDLKPVAGSQVGDISLE